MKRHACLLLTLAALAAGPCAAGSDYMPPDLRARVDQLKADMASIPTNTTNVRARAELTWQWLNAYALNGGYMPVNATMVIAQVLGVRGRNERLMVALDQTINEFAFLDSNPDAIGNLQADIGPHRAGSVGTIIQTYTVGAMPVQTGGGFLVARHFMTNFGEWQVNDASAPNYISIDSSNDKVSFVATTAPMGGMHGGFRTSRATLVFKVASGTLQPGDTVTIRYGDTRQGSPGLSMPSFSSDRMPLPIYLAFADGGHYYSLPIQPIRIEGSKLAGVTGFAPSIVKPGESFELAIRARDRYFNRASGALPKWLVQANGAPLLSAPSSGAITVVETTLDTPGTYYLTISSEDGGIAGQVNPILVTDESRPGIYWGDTHGHSGFAEGIGTPERFMRWARDDARLDFVTHSEHDIWLDDAEWEVLRDNVRKFSEDGRFAAYLGYEWTVNTTGGGHHNVLFRNPENRNRIPAQFYPTLSRLYQGLRNNAQLEDVVVIPHAHQSGDYRLSDPELEPLVEIMSQHGNFEWFGRMYLQHGHQVGFTAASDNHLSQPGYSAPLGGSLSQRGGLGAILANERSADAIFDGMKSLQAYATTGDRIILDFSVNGTAMGQRAPFTEHRAIAGRAIGTAPIDNVSVIRNGEVVWSKNYIDKKAKRPDKSETLLLSFYSDSDPFHPNDNPRGWRAWQGTLTVNNAELVSIEPVDASFPMQEVTSTQSAPNQVTFATKTRGDTSSYLIRLNNVQRSTTLQFDIDENIETGGAPPFYRPAKRVPADSFSLALKDFADGSLTHTQTFDGYQDTTTLRRGITDGAREVEFEFTDTGLRHGDYYFVRVVQANDAIAWSSPVWIGGHATR